VIFEATKQSRKNAKRRASTISAQRHDLHFGRFRDGDQHINVEPVKTSLAFPHQLVVKFTQNAKMTDRFLCKRQKIIAVELLQPDNGTATALASGKNYAIQKYQNVPTTNEIETPNLFCGRNISDNREW